MNTIWQDHHVVVFLQTLHEHLTGGPVNFTANQFDKSTRVVKGTGGANLTDVTGEYGRQKSFILEQKSTEELLQNAKLQLMTQRSKDAWKYMESTEEPWNQFFSSIESVTQIWNYYSKVK